MRPSWPRGALLLVLLLAWWLPVEALAHPFAPPVLELRAEGHERLEFELRVAGSGPSVMSDRELAWPEFPETCRRTAGSDIGSGSFADQGGGVGAVAVRRIVVRCERPSSGASFRVRAPTDRALVFVHRGGDTVTTRVVRGELEIPIPGAASAVDTDSGMLGMVETGVRHILGGLDHLLFVACILLLTADTRRRLLAITMFTLAHSITLGLAAASIVNVPAPPVEAIIAASVVLMAADLTRERGRVGTGSLVTTVFFFGLLHGLGFAGALHELGLGKENLLLDIFAFNVGVEIGQLAFIAATWLVLGLARKVLPRTVVRDATSRRRRTVVAYAIGIVAATMFVDRVVGFWGG